MCEPVSIATLCIGVISAAASATQQHSAQKAQTRYQEAQSKAYAEAAVENNKATNKEYVEKMAAERIQEMQEKHTASEDTIASKKDVMQKKGTMMASTAAGGAALNMLMADYDRQEAVNSNAILEQYEMSKVGHATNVSNYQLSAQNTVNAQQDYIVSGSGSSGLGTALGIAATVGAGAVSAWDKHEKATAAK